MNFELFSASTFDCATRSLESHFSLRSSSLDGCELRSEITIFKFICSLKPQAQSEFICVLRSEILPLVHLLELECLRLSSCAASANLNFSKISIEE